MGPVIQNLDMLFEGCCEYVGAFLEQPVCVAGLRVLRHVLEVPPHHREDQVPRVTDRQQLRTDGVKSKHNRTPKFDPGVPISISIATERDRADLGQHFFVGEGVRGLGVQTVVHNYLQ